MDKQYSDEEKAKLRKSFPQSHYIDKVQIDFEDLPNYVINKGIIWRFEQQRSGNNGDYYEWQNKLVEFLNTIPDQYRLKAMQKGIEYAKKVYEYHQLNECKAPNQCTLNESWERRLVLAENMLKRAEEQIKPIDEDEHESLPEKNKEFTMARQVLAMHFIFEYMQLKETEIDKTNKAKFIEFLTGKDYKKYL
jgi:hypothetical protein